MAKSRPSLEGIAMGMTPEQFADFVKIHPQTSRAGLELVLREAPEVYRSVVPQVYDQQTGLFSKVYFEGSLLPAALERSGIESVPLSYLLLDIDNFHQFNEEHGHQKGDDAIALVAGLLNRTFRTNARRTTEAKVHEEQRDADRRGNDYTDSVGVVDSYTPQGRVGGGEEFAVILYGTDEANALNIANRFLKEVERLEIKHPDGPLKITMSGGIAEYHRGMFPQDLIKNADRALMYSKVKGKNRITGFSQIQKSG